MRTLITNIVWDCDDRRLPKEEEIDINSVEECDIFYEIYETLENRYDSTLMSFDYNGERVDISRH